MQRPVIDVPVMLLFNGLTFRKVDHSMSSAFLHRRNLQNSLTMVVPHFDSKKLCSLETGATPAKSERSSRFRSLDGCILKAGFFGVISTAPETSKSQPCKRWCVCILGQGSTDSWRTVKGAVVCFFEVCGWRFGQKCGEFFSGYPESRNNLQQLEVQRSNWFFHISKVTCQMQDTFCLMSPLPKSPPVRPSLPREFQADSPPGLHCMSPTFGTPERWKGQKPCNGSMHSFRVWLIFLFPPFQMKCGCVFP